MTFTDNTTNSRVIIQGIMPIKIAVEDTCDVGDLIGYDNITDTAWERADANGKIPAVLVAGEPCHVSGDEITCYKMAYVGGFSGATPGDMVYLADDVGDYAATPASWVHQCVGQAISATEAFVCPDSQALTGFVTTGTGYAAYIRGELAATRTKADIFGGARIDCKVIDGALGINDDMFGAVITCQFQDTDCAGYGAVLRLEDNSSASCKPKTFLSIHGDCDYLMYFSPEGATHGAWDHDVSVPTNAAGQLKLRLGGVTRYIALYSTSGS